MSPTPPPGDDQVVVAVVRSGGVAGIRRRWTVAAPPEDAGVWIALIDSCPWDSPSDDAALREGGGDDGRGDGGLSGGAGGSPTEAEVASDAEGTSPTGERTGAAGADRFVWSIRARTPSEQHEQRLTDAALDGPWRTLVEAVRAASR